MVSEGWAAIGAGEHTLEDRPQDRYHIDPRELVRIQRQGHERGLDIVGFYHSHPDHPARWSQTDLAEAHWIGCSYVITAVEHGKAAQTKHSLCLPVRRKKTSVLRTKKSSE